MSLKRLLPLLITLLVISLAVLFLKRTSPFGLVFWGAWYTGIVSICGLVLAVGVILIRKKTLFPKIVSLIPLFLGLVMLALFFMSIWDYRMIVPITSANDLSAVAYEDDIAYLKVKLRQHPAYTTQMEGMINQKLAKFDFEKDLVSRNEFVLTVTSLVGLFQDGHSFVPPIQVFNKARYLPLSGYYFGDGYYILDAADKYSVLKNTQLLAINGQSFEAVYAKLKAAFGPENEWNAKSRLNHYLFSANTLESLGILESDQCATISYRDHDGNEQEIKVSSEPFLNWFFWAFRPIQNRLPVSNNLRKPNFQLHLADGVGELELNMIEDNSEESTIANLAIELDSLFRTGTIKRFIIDLRNNTGGNNHLYKSLIAILKAHPQINDSTRLFVLMGRNTFSAGVNFLDDLRFETNATFVGEPAGAGPTHYGDAEVILLPNSGIYFFQSTKQWTAHDTTHVSKATYPDVQVQYEFEDYLDQRDPWMLAVDSLVRNTR